MRIPASGGGDPAADVVLVAAGRKSIPASSAALASASPVLEDMLCGRRCKDRRCPSSSSPARTSVIRIAGVTFDAAQAFVRMLHSTNARPPLSSLSSTSATATDLEKYGVQLLVLSHAYRVGWLKRAAEEALASRLTVETVVDSLQLARECDAPRLYLLCMALMGKDLAAVEQTEAWHFIHDNDPWLELEILQFLHESHLTTKQRRRKRKDQDVYLHLSEAMECLRHICTEGCMGVGPSRSGGGAIRVSAAAATAPIDRKEEKEKENEKEGGAKTCPSFQTCRGVQLLIMHFAACRRKRACLRCRRMLQIFQLQSSMCDTGRDDEPCRVPLCRQFKTKSKELQGNKMAVDGDDDDGRDRWSVLVRKVSAARAMCTLAREIGYMHGG